MESGSHNNARNLKPWRPLVWQSSNLNAFPDLRHDSGGVRAVVSVPSAPWAVELQGSTRFIENGAVTSEERAVVEAHARTAGLDDLHPGVFALHGVV
jgi:hypothetical protein